MKTLADLYRQHQGKVSDKWSLYLQEYDDLFTEYRTRPVNFLEIGIQNGGSLEIWSQYFLNARRLVGCDINPMCDKLSYEDSRVKVVVGDINTDRCEQLILELATAFDLIVDDGSHRSSDIIRAFARYFPHLRDGGKFIVEDMHCSYWREFEGGLFDPDSSMAFFKLLADIINRQHWGVGKTVNDLLAKIEKRYDVRFEEKILSHIKSVTFLNSMCVIAKDMPEKSILGERVIAGNEGIVFPPCDFISGGLNWSPEQSTNVLAMSCEELQQTVRTLQQEKESIEREKDDLHRRSQVLEAENNALQLTKEGLLREIEAMINSASWRITRPLRFVWNLLRWRR